MTRETTLDDRTLRALDDVELLTGVTGGTATVAGFDNERYEVDAVDGVCTCPDFRHRGLQCKHLRAVRAAAAGGIGAAGVGGRAHTRRDA